MATKANTTTRATRNTIKKAEPVKTEPAVVETVQPETDNPVRTASEPRTAHMPQVVDLDPNMYVPVRNGFNGKLIYVSRKSGERYVWEHFGDEQDMELRELRAAKTSYKAFYENNWFLIDDPAVIEYLGVERFYKNALSFEEFDTLFDLDAEAIEKRVSALSKGQQNSLKYRARQLIRDGKIDSIKVINTLERLLETELIEK